jgi:hypothetical protein
MVRKGNRSESECKKAFKINKDKMMLAKIKNCEQKNNREIRVS